MKILFESTFNHQLISNKLKLLYNDFEIDDGQYNNLFNSIANPLSNLNTGNYDYKVLFANNEVFKSSQLLKSPLNNELLNSIEAQYLTYIDAALNLAKECKIIITTLDENEDNIFLDLPPRNESIRDKIRKLNTKILSLPRLNSNIFILDLNYIYSQEGRLNSEDKRLEYIASSKFNPNMIQRISTDIGKLITNSSCPKKKVIVLDADNTLWKGILGEDGIDGIGISYDGPNKSFYDFQCILKGLKEIGFLICLCSKNNHNDIIELFAKREMPLTLNDFTSIKANWNDKASNIIEISKEVNLGLESFIFFDDNPSEREWVKSSIPEVFVPELPEQYELYPNFINNISFLKKYHSTFEDSKRTELYKTEVRRNKLAQSSKDYTEFLLNLNIKCEVRLANLNEVKRATQLFNRTNQFNLTTKRYSENDVENFISNREMFVLYVSDKFGEHGLTGLCVIRKKNKMLEIDSFLLSCRILSKDIEHYFFNKAIELISTNSNTIIIGKYIKSAKNSQAANFYLNHGFDIAESDCNYTVYQSRLKDIKNIKISHIQDIHGN